MIFFWQRNMTIDLNTFIWRKVFLRFTKGPVPRFLLIRKVSVANVNTLMNEILLVSFWILFGLNTYRFMAKVFLLQYSPVSSFFLRVMDDNFPHSRVKFRRRRFCILLFENTLQKTVMFLMYNWSLIYVKFRHHFHKCTNKPKNMEKWLFCDNMTEKRRQNQEGSVTRFRKVPFVPEGSVTAMHRDE